MDSKGLEPAVQERGYAAVSRFLRYAVGRLEPGEQPPPMPDGLEDWPETILPGLMAGLAHGVYSGLKQTQGARLSVRAVRTLDAAVGRTLTLASVACLFFGVEMLTAVYRGKRSFFVDATAGGLAVSGAYAAHHYASARVWPPPPLSQKVVPIMAIALIQGQMQRAQHVIREQEAAEEAKAAEEQRRQEALEAHKQQDAASVLLAQLQSRLAEQEREVEQWEQQERRAAGEAQRQLEKAADTRQQQVEEWVTVEEWQQQQQDKQQQQAAKRRWWRLGW